MSPAKKAAARKSTPKKTTRASGRSDAATARKKKASSASGSTKSRAAASKKASSRTAKETTAKTSTGTTRSTASSGGRKRTTGKSSKKTAARPAKTTAKRGARTAASSPSKTKSTRGKKTTGREPADVEQKATSTPAAGSRKPNRSKQAERRPRRANFDAAQLQQIRERLLSERRGLEKDMAELDESAFDSTPADVSGEVGVDDDFADAGSATFERERDLSIRNNMRDLIDQISRAVQRIDDGTYGTCERCGKPIDAARLKALPHALLCMDCKRREERAR